MVTCKILSEDNDSKSTIIKSWIGTHVMPGALARRSRNANWVEGRTYHDTCHDFRLPPSRIAVSVTWLQVQ